MNDMVNHPKHYTSHPTGMECFDVIKGLPAEIANPIKYVWRADLKNGLEDLEKAIWYLKKCDGFTFGQCVPNRESRNKFVDETLKSGCDRLPMYIVRASLALSEYDFLDAISGCIDVINLRIDRIRNLEVKSN